MDFRNGRESGNVEDRRGQGGRGLRGGGRIGIGTIVLALVAMYFGIDPGVVLNTAMTDPAPAGSAATRPPGNDAQARFVSMVLADTEDTWHALFREGSATYREPQLVLYTGATRSACGVGQAEMGPFYCPADAKVYLDLSFFDELQHRFGAPGDFAQAYVIAHEIGHHVQNLLGISGKVQEARARVPEREANQLSVRLELQADCLAGIWAHHANRSRGVLEAGDIEEGLAAATAVGDDHIQKRAQGYAVPESFTHGSAEQRRRWFGIGLQQGRFQACDTFGTGRL